MVATEQNDELDVNEAEKPVKPVATYAQPSEYQAREIKQKKQLLEDTFNLIHKTRMHDIPILNDKIKVAAIGFNLWEGTYICVMVTPWFMNLMLLPGEDEDWDELDKQTKQSHVFPSGRYTFITGFEPAIGKYQTCSLFSPMFEFADNVAAVDTAEAAIKELLNVENIEELDIDAQQIEDIWNGDIPHPDIEDAQTQALNEAKVLSDEQKKNILEEKTLAEKLETPISRRQMLRGKFFGDDEKS